MQRQKKWVTMGDVAKRAGVGKITVSRAFRTPEKVNVATRQKIREAVEELGYVLDETAGALSSKRTRTVCAVVSTLDQSVFSSTVDGLTDGLSEHGMQLFLGTANYNAKTEETLLNTFMGRRPDAVVLTNSLHTERAIQNLITSNLPIFELWELPDTPLYAAVGFSNFQAGKDITHYLLAREKKKIAFIRIKYQDECRGRLRMEGYCDAIKGTDTPRIIELPHENGVSAAEFGAKGLSRIVERWPDTDAVVCASDPLALGVWCEAMRRGISIPQELALTGFGDFELAGASALGLTTVHIDGYKMGRTAADLIHNYYSGGTEIPKVTNINYTIIQRNSA
jgi:LacI family transcriptional regulator, gluconate utilization system Gnt-I transcriptional repressor